MSLLTQNKLSTLNPPAANKIRYGMLPTRNTAWTTGGQPLYIDEFSNQWFYGKQRVVLTADTSNETAGTLTNVPGLAFSLAANTRYGVRFVMLYQAGATTIGLTVAVTAPATPTVISLAVDIYGFAAAGSASCYSGVITSAAVNVKSTTTVAIGNTYIAVSEGVIVTAATAGTLQLQWAGGAGGVLLKQGTLGELWLL
jgi:hypothetical protein